MKYDSNMAELALYDRLNDPGEATNVIGQYPEIHNELSKVADMYRKELGDKLKKMKGSGVRPAGELEPGDEKLEW